MAAARWMSRPRVFHTPPVVDAAADGSGAQDDLERIMGLLSEASVVVDRSGLVLRASVSAQALGIVSGEKVQIPAISRLAAKVIADRKTRERQISARRPPLKKDVLDLHVRVAALADGTGLIVIEDRSQTGRFDAVRRDFVANVSHELKTPVGALSLLAEAVSAASDDPDAVRRFSERMLVEAARLTELIKDLVDLSRLESDDPLARATLVSADQVVTAAVDATRMAAAGKQIEVVCGRQSKALVYGDQQQLEMAVRNLLVNAIAYSPGHTRVSVAVRERGGLVDISVKDQGIGIPAEDLERIFERFYRVDTARSRATGGTGLGLAIVKHVCQRHGGECAVWSVEGEGSTFTMRIPAASPTSGEERPVRTGKDSQ